MNREVNGQEGRRRCFRRSSAELQGVSEVMNEMNADGRFRSYDLSVMSR